MTTKVKAGVIAPEAVENAAIAGNAVTTDKVALDTLTAADLAPDSVGTSEVADGAIGTADLAATLDLSSKTLTMPPNGSRVGEVVQVVNFQTGAVATGTTSIPHDDTIPQNTEGDEYMTLAITPKSASNKLIIDVIFQGTMTANGPVTVALFQDSTANALAAVAQHPGSASIVQSIALRHNMTAGTTSATTFKVRAGAAGAATTTFNGASGGRKFGGVSASSITITEIKQ